MSEINELLTIRDFIRYAISRFNEASLNFGHGTDNAVDEAFALILHTLYLPNNLHSDLLDTRLLPSERHLLNNKIERRIRERIPVPYLTNEAWFSGLSFYVDERVLIPRSPIAELIEQHFEPWIEPESVQNILDLCTGSGCIAITAAKAFPWSTVDAIDISSDALAVAKINTLRHHVEDQVHLIQSDLFDKLPEKKYDIILSNPPYVDQADMMALPPEFKHEPSLGLAGGESGLDIVFRILEKAPDYLTPHGILIVEVGNSEQALAEALPDVPFTWLEFARGGGGVFLMTQNQLSQIKYD